MATMRASRGAEMEPLTSGASNRIIPVLRALQRSLVFVYTLLFSLLLLLPRRRQNRRLSPSKLRKREEEDTLRRRALAEGLEMVFDDGEGASLCRWDTCLFSGVTRNSFFCRSWFPVSGQTKGILLIIHGLNEH
ncbi:hypothetical protein CRG98_031490, partial [Punica granatum]